MRKIRVLQFASSNSLLGAERWILALVRYSDSSQVKHVIFTIKDSPHTRVDLIEKAEEMGFCTDMVYAKGAFDPRAISRTAALIRKHKVDILHTHGYKSDIIGFLAARMTGIPIISTPHGSELSIDPRLNLYNRIGDRFIKWVNCVVPVSKGLKDEYLDKGLNPDKIRVIKNGVDILEVEKTQPHEGFLSLKSEKRLKLIGFVGQLIKRKGLPDLIKAMKTVVETAPARLIFVGDGQMREKLEDMVIKEGLSNSIEFLGFRSDRLEIMKCFDIFVLPSYLEGIPRVIMEAMAARIPVIATDIPGVREIVHNNKTGMLVPVNSPEQLAVNILRLLNDQEKVDRLRQSAFDNVNLNHSAERMAVEYTGLYRELLNRSDN